MIGTTHKFYGVITMRKTRVAHAGNEVVRYSIVGSLNLALPRIGRLDILQREEIYLERIQRGPTSIIIVVLFGNK